MSEQHKTQPIDWDAAGQVAKDSIAMTKLILAAVDGAGKKLKTRTPAKAKPQIKPR